MQTNKKAITPIVATILLVVVAVILVTITLSWGKGFTNKGLEGSNTILKETTNNYMIGSPKLNAQGVLSFKNISPGDKSITITGYKIISSSDDGNFNTILDIEDTTISPGGTHIISIPAFPPEQKVTIQLITDENEYISVGSITNIPEEQQDIPVEEGPEPQQYVAGPFSPGTVVDDNCVGTKVWVSPENAVTSDNIYSRATSSSANATTHYLKATNFGFNIPTGATIDGIKVEIEKYGASMSYGTSDYSVKIVKSDGTIGSSGKEDIITTWSQTDPNAYINYGDLNDRWGETWTTADINNSNFGVVISAKISAGCLNENTMVTLENGQKPIKDLVIGDIVFSYNEITKQLELKPIINILSIPISSTNNRYFYIYYNNGRVIKATENHEFYVSGTYKRADELKIGDLVMSSDLYKYPIDDIKIIENTTDYVWDIEVEDNHNFFANDILVHNVNLYAYVDHIRMTVYYTN